MMVTRLGNHNKGRQLHNRHLHAWRWEYNLYRFIGINWQDMALNREDLEEQRRRGKIQSDKEDQGDDWNVVLSVS